MAEPSSYLFRVTLLGTGAAGRALLTELVRWARETGTV